MVDGRMEDQIVGVHLEFFTTCGLTEEIMHDMCQIQPDVRMEQL